MERSISSVGRTGTSATTTSGGIRCVLLFPLLLFLLLLFLLLLLLLERLLGNLSFQALQSCNKLADVFLRHTFASGGRAASLFGTGAEPLGKYWCFPLLALTKYIATTRRIREQKGRGDRLS